MMIRIDRFLPLAIGLSFALATTAVAQTQYGQGCGGTSRVGPAIAMQGDPHIGQEVQIQVLNAQANAACMLMLGFSRTSFGGFSLPLNMAPLGAGAQCELLVDPQLTFSNVVNGNGIANMAMYIPNNQSLIGLRFFTQWAVFATRSLAGMQMTAALDAGVGDRWWCGNYKDSAGNIEWICRRAWTDCPATATLSSGNTGNLVAGSCKKEG